MFDKIISADTILTFLLQWEIEEERQRENRDVKRGDEGKQNLLLIPLFMLSH